MPKNRVPFRAGVAKGNSFGIGSSSNIIGGSPERRTGTYRGVPTGFYSDSTQTAQASNEYKKQIVQNVQ